MRQADGKRCSSKRIILLIVTGLVLVSIFVQSSLPKRISAEESGWFADYLLDPLFQFLGLDRLGDHAIRKAAHVTEFAILSALLALCFRGQAVKSAGFGFAAAFLDESIQLLSERGALVSDIWIDLIGIVTGSVLGWLIWRAIRKRRSSTQKQG